jgi:hypothetical protein
MMLKSISAFAVTWFPMAYLVAAWVACAWYVFDQGAAILAIGVFVGITIVGYSRLTSGQNAGVVKEDDHIDFPAKAAVLVASLCFCAMLVYLIDSGFRVYQLYAGSPIFAVGWIYVPALILGIASAGYVKLIAMVISKRSHAKRGLLR